MKRPRKIIPIKMTFLTMNINEFVPFKISEDIDNSVPFVAISDTYPNDKFEPWTKENWEEMKEKNSEKSVDSFTPLW
jgi:hypothetical protein